MVKIIQIEGYENFDNYAKDINFNVGWSPPVYFYFTGSKMENGRSWCPDCEEGIYLFYRHKIFVILTSQMPTKHHKSKHLFDIDAKIKILNINNYDEFNNFVDNLPENGPSVFFFFTGKNKENGKSWCIYCQLAEPVVKAYLSELDQNLVFAYVDVGDREYWKDKACPFRTDKRTHLMVIPTIIKWKGVQRLEGSQCNKRELLQMMFEQEEA